MVIAKFTEGIAICKTQRSLQNAIRYWPNDQIALHFAIVWFGQIKALFYNTIRSC